MGVSMMKIARFGIRPASRILLGIGALAAALLAPSPALAGFHEIVLSAFCTGTGCTEGDGPRAGLIQDRSGNFYGTTVAGGTAGGGTVFELSPNATRTGWTLKTLYSFCSLANCADGEIPLASLIMDDAGRLYGTTGYGGTGLGLGGSPGAGTVFELAPNADRTAWTETVLYSFCPQANYVDGFNPSGSLVMDRAGNLYSTTYEGGTGIVDGGGGAGTVFELSPNARLAGRSAIKDRHALLIDEDRRSSRGTTAAAERTAVSDHLQTRCARTQKSGQIYL
jgi:uncharacterized repeat protein (TIGR03803 family)